MALITADRVKETSTTTGTGTLTLAGAVNGFKSFADIGNGNQCYYAIVGVAVPSEWEVGIGTYTASGTTLSRDTVLRSSTGSKVSFSAGTKEVFVTYPADHSLSQADTGTAPNQVPLNQYLGSMAYEDNDSVNITGGVATLSSANISTITNNPTFSGGTANGVAYLNASKVLTTGSALTFDGSTLGLISAGLNTQNSTSDTVNPITVSTNQIRMGASGFVSFRLGTAYDFNIDSYNAASPINLYNVTQAGTHKWSVLGSEQMRLTSTGLGIGTSSPDTKLTLAGNGHLLSLTNPSSAIANGIIRWKNSSGTTQAFIGSYVNIADTGNLEFGNGTTTTLNLTASGNLGLGVTPSAWISTVKAFDINAGASFIGSSLAASMWSNSFVAAGAVYKYKANGAAAFYDQAGGQHAWYNAPSGTAGGTITFTQAMTLDASGNLGIGTTSPQAKLHVVGEVLASNSDSKGVVSISSTALDQLGAELRMGPRTTTSAVSAGIKAYHYGTNDADLVGLQYYTRNSGTASDAAIKVYEQTYEGTHIFSRAASATTSTESMRIDSSGNVGIGTSSPTAKLDVNSNVVRVRTAKTPASATDTGNAGDICWDSNYVYVCVATNTWKRSAIATW